MSLPKGRGKMAQANNPAHKDRGVYSEIILKIFKSHYKPGIKSFLFSRDEIRDICARLNFMTPKNFGDVLYSFRYRKSLPYEIIATAPKGYEWIIAGAGNAIYKFELSKINRIVPRENLIEIKIPDATPSLIEKYALTDEQALLAKIRYNKIIDLFLQISSYSLQNHLRTKIKSMGQVEIDEVYVGVNKFGAQFIVPVQAKGGNDKHGIVQTMQDIACCQEKFPDLICRPVSVQFISKDKIAIFELRVEENELKVVEEKHYRLVKYDEISKSDLKFYANNQA